jgi:glycine cleavage system regulatory protein
MEKNLISKLKIEVGFNSVRKMETMFKDMEASRDLMLKYKDSHGESIEHIEVLTSG